MSKSSTMDSDISEGNIERIRRSQIPPLDYFNIDMPEEVLLQTSEKPIIVHGAKQMLPDLGRCLAKQLLSGNSDHLNRGFYYAEVVLAAGSDVKEAVMAELSREFYSLEDNGAAKAPGGSEESMTLERLIDVLQARHTTIVMTFSLPEGGDEDSDDEDNWIDDKEEEFCEIVTKLNQGGDCAIFVCCNRDVVEILEDMELCKDFKTYQAPPMAKALVQETLVTAAPAIWDDMYCEKIPFIPSLISQLAEIFRDPSIEITKEVMKRVLTTNSSFWNVSAELQQQLEPWMAKVESIIEDYYLEEEYYSFSQQRKS